VNAFAEAWLPLALSKVKDTGRAYVCIGAYPEELAAYMRVAMPTQILVWTYKNTLGPTPKGRYKQNWQAVLYYAKDKAEPLDCQSMLEQFSVQEINAPDGRLGDRYHAWQKPLELAERFIRHSTKPGDVVLDPFACTGTFLLAAAKLGRRAAGCDIDEANIAIAVERGCEQ
jgi:site-specific DNA-methyltransferase (adenine-specific)